MLPVRWARLVRWGRSVLLVRPVRWAQLVRRGPWALQGLLVQQAQPAPAAAPPAPAAAPAASESAKSAEPKPAAKTGGEGKPAAKSKKNAG